VIPKALLYTKDECPLCDQAKGILDRLAGEGLLSWQTVDIEEDPTLSSRYWDKIPVVQLDGGQLWYGKISEFRLRQALRERGSEREEKWAK